MSMIVSVELCSVKKIMRDIDSKDVDYNREDIMSVVEKVAQYYGYFVDSDRFIIVCNEYRDEYNPWFNFCDFIERYFDISLSLNISQSIDKPGELPIVAAEELGLELKDEYEDES